jgi:hypothetical protein
MELLAYCAVATDEKISIPPTGVQTAEITTVEESGLQCLVSQFRTGNSTRVEPLRDSAVVFNHVLQSVLQQSALIPFRFPTVVADEAEVSRYLHEHESEFRELLLRFKGMVQMEIQIHIDGKSEHEQSGAGFLRSRQEQLLIVRNALGDLHGAVSPYLRNWRVRESANRGRGYALVDRNSVPEFLARAKAIALPRQVRARITGPWPVSEFVREK